MPRSDENRRDLDPRSKRMHVTSVKVTRMYARDPAYRPTGHGAVPANRHNGRLRGTLTLQRQHGWPGPRGGRLAAGAVGKHECRWGLGGGMQHSRLAENEEFAA